MEQLDRANLELCHWRGVKSVKFDEVFPVIRDNIKKGVTIDGSRFVPSLEPYKMVTIEYEKSITNGMSGICFLTGVKDGKIMISGYKKSDK